ncbi:NAD(P)-dependent oxidoreductase [Dactylosporangium sp. CA-139066]|uniref:NAD(P)-dependent oxidoreductase n=1 Tax=Dactylosporangium sp. CA-139066 TaxID=3239930 RepID=UPI003D91419E
MTSLVVFGAGGRAGRRIMAEAARRGVDATGVVRDPAKYPHLSGTIVAGDATDADSVVRAADGHDVAVSAVYGADLDPAQYAEAMKALLQGLERAGVGRLLMIGVATTLPAEHGEHRLFEAPDFPAEWRPFSQARADELTVLDAYTGPIDWVVFTPPMELTDEEADSRYKIGNSGNRLTYAALAAAILDEATEKTHQRVQLAISGI